MSTNVDLQEIHAGESPQGRVCSNCSTDFQEHNCLKHEDEWLCKGCYSEQVSSCKKCEQMFWRDDMRTITGALYCDLCTAECFRYCSGCQEYVEDARASYSEIHDTDYCDNCFSNYVTYCVSCDSQIDPDYCMSNDDGECYCDDCWQRRDDPGSSGYIEFFSETFQRCPSGRKYGIEIEALLEEGKDHLPSDQNQCWRQVHDGSLGENGREFVSPIFHGDQGFNEIEKFCEVLKQWGYFVKRQCGLHVHIDGRDLICEDVKMLLKITRYFEPVLYAMLPPSRYEGTYSVPLERFPKSRFRIKACDEEALKRFWYGRTGEKVDLKSKYHHSRYYGLNIHSWFFRRSLEFRYHSGTLNPAKIMNFITICQTFVDRAKETKRFKMESPPDFHSHFESFVSFLKLSPDLALYVRQRIMKFNPDRLPVPVALSA